MGMSRRVYIALFAVLVELAAVAATGNQAVANFVADHMATSPLGDLFLRTLPSFPWRVTTESRTGASTILLAQYAAIATLLVLTFVLVLLIVRGTASFVGAFFASIGAVVTASLIAHMVGNIVDYDQVGRAEHTGLGRVGYSLFNSNDGLTIMYSLLCGLVVGLVTGIVAVVIRRRMNAQVEAATLEAAAIQRAVPDTGYTPVTAPWDPGGYAAGNYGASPVYPPAYPPQYEPETFEQPTPDHESMPAAPAADAPGTDAPGTDAPVAEASPAEEPPAQQLHPEPHGEAKKPPVE